MRQVIIYPGEDGYWVAEVPSLSGCVSQGSTREEAIASIRDAIEVWVDVMAERGEAIPPESFDAQVCVV